MATGTWDAVKVLMSLLKEAGLVAGRFDANDIFDLDLDQIQSSTQGLFDRLKALVGEIQPKTGSAMPDPGLPTHIGSTGCRTASPYVSAAEGSDTFSEPRRMSLGPSGAAMLQARSQIHQREKSKPRSKRQPIASMDPTTSASDTSAGRLETYFQAAMSRFLKEQQVLSSPPTPIGTQNPGSQDGEMSYVGSPDPDPHWDMTQTISTSRHRLTLLRLPDVDEQEEVLRALDRAKNRQKKSAFGSNKYRQKAPANPAPAAAAKHVRAIQIQAPDSGSERSDSDCDEHRRIYAAVNQDNARSAGEESKGLDRGLPNRPQHDRMTHDHRSRTTDPTAVAVRTVDLRSIRILDAGDV
ncbi:unnamed protein product [Phytophthora fragariaefolia]|uniref:Unnamed protein product n=1 Tax=Phytophthora fragariaefolia TaxID=1490495 RepID=A0A9W6X9E3_9STRA|nr:unnamed protein product [Phytophthora fragariaefolia]